MSNTVHATAIIAGDVTLGTGNTIGPFVTITGPVTIGDDNWIGAGAVIGAPPEVRSADHARSFDGPNGGGVTIGSRNILREYMQVHQGWELQTTLGNDIMVMNQSYIAHDCQIGDGATLASSVLLAGNVELGKHANLGMGVVVHQGRRIGGVAMIGMASVITRDIPPLAIAFGNPARVRGANGVGMSRAGIPADLIDRVERQYSSGQCVDIDSLRELEELVVYFAGWGTEE